MSSRSRSPHARPAARTTLPDVWPARPWHPPASSSIEFARAEREVSIDFARAERELRIDFARAERELRRVHAHEQARILAELCRAACARLPFGSAAALFDPVELRGVLADARDERRWSRADGARVPDVLAACLRRPPDDWPCASELARAAARLREGVEQRLALALASLCAGDAASARERALALLALAERAHVDPVSLRARSLGAQACIVLGLADALDGDLDAASERLRSACERDPDAHACAAASAELARQLAALRRSPMSLGARVPAGTRRAREPRGARAMATFLRASNARAAAASRGADIHPSTSNDDPPGRPRPHDGPMRSSVRAAPTARFLSRCPASSRK